MTLFNVWHYLVLTVIFLIFVGGVLASLNQESQKMKYSMLFSVSLISLFLAIFSLFVVDKYTKKVQLEKLHNRRLLSTEEISYSGIVKNVGRYPIGHVTFHIKLVNHGNATGTVKGTNFYKPSGFKAFFTEGLNMRDKPQTVEKDFVVARDLKPGEIERFRVYFKYPPYFSQTAQFAKVYGH